jgi:hypothetical protein
LISDPYLVTMFERVHGLKIASGHALSPPVGGRARRQSYEKAAARHYSAPAASRW